MTLPPLPLTDEVLDQVEHALGAVYEVTETGEHVLTGADFTLSTLLDFLAGHDPEDCYLDGYGDLGLGGAPIYISLSPSYSVHDLVKALVAEVRRTRAALHADTPEEGQ